MGYVRVGTEIKNTFAQLLADAPSDCLCFDRAKFLDIMGPKWCRRNIATIVEWLEEEMDMRKVFEDEATRARMVAYAKREAMALGWVVGWIAAKLVGRNMKRKGSGRRLMLTRLVRILIRRAELKKG